MQLVVAVQVDHGVAGVQILEAPEVLDVAAQPEVIAEVAHHARPSIPSKVVRRRAHACDRAAVDLRAKQPDAPRDERTDAGPMSAAPEAAAVSVYSSPKASSFSAA